MKLWRAVWPKSLTELYQQKWNQYLMSWHCPPRKRKIMFGFNNWTDGVINSIFLWQARSCGREIGKGRASSQNRDKESTPIFGADLISVQLETSLVHISSHIETTLLRHTFIGSTNSSDESIVNVEYQGDNVEGFFDHNCNHTLKFGPNTRRLHGPVYMARRYQSSLDEEMVGLCRYYLDWF